MIENIIKNRQLFLGYLLLCMLLLNMTSCRQYLDARESQRKEFFAKNFDAFQKLEQMQLEDIRQVGQVSINRDFGNLSKARLSEYRKLMKQAGIEYFSYVSDEPKKRMVRFYEDIDIVDSGYVYMEYPPPKFFRKFSECEPILPSLSCYILLRKNWYMFHERYRLKQE